MLQVWRQTGASQRHSDVANEVALRVLLDWFFIEKKVKHMTQKQATPFKAVKSSNVDGYHYDAVSKTLHIKFKTGKTYQYGGVPQDALDALLGAPSFGSHVSRHIIPKFKLLKV